MNLIGMTPHQFLEVTYFVQQHHHFAKWLSVDERQKEIEEHPNIPEHGFNIKYVDSCYDTRSGDVWMVKFRGVNNYTFSTNSLIGSDIKNFPYKYLYDWVMDYLRGEWSDENILKLCEIE